jgi:hypothetical protein
MEPRHLSPCIDNATVPFSNAVRIHPAPKTFSPALSAFPYMATFSAVKRPCPPNLTRNVTPILRGTLLYQAAAKSPRAIALPGHDAGSHWVLSVRLSLGIRSETLNYIL